MKEEGLKCTVFFMLQVLPFKLKKKCIYEIEYSKCPCLVKLGQKATTSKMFTNNDS